MYASYNKETEINHVRLHTPGMSIEGFGTAILELHVSCNVHDTLNIERTLHT